MPHTTHISHTPQPKTRAEALVRHRRVSIVAALFITLMVLGGLVIAEGMNAQSADAAPNPYRGKIATHLVTIAADGTYDVETVQVIDMALESDYPFGGEIHDGFRLPDTEALLPPYLRAEYSDPSIVIAGQPAEVAVEKEIHAVDISALGKLPKGKTEGTVDYRVTGAAVPAGKHVDVYFRPLVSGDLIVRSESPILAAHCEDWPPQGEPCGGQEGDVWTFSKNELRASDRTDVEAVRITVDADPDDLVEPVIDTEF